MDVQLPNGVVIQGVPEGTTKEEVKRKAIAAGLATEADFGGGSVQKPQEQPPTEMATDPEAQLMQPFMQEQKPFNLTENLRNAGLMAPEGGKTPDQQQQDLQTLTKNVLGLGVGAAKGAVLDPLVGAAQIGAHAVGLGSEADKLVKQYKATVEPFSNKPAEFIGAVVSPVNKLFGPVAGMGKIKTVVKSAGAAATLSTLQPTEADAFWADKAFSAALGGVIGGTIPVAGYTLKWLKNLTKDINLTDASRLDALRRQMLEYIPEGELKKILSAARQGDRQLVAGSQPTVGQMIANEPAAARLVKQEAELAGRNAPGFIQRADEQAAARMAALGTLGGGQAGAAEAQAGKEAAVGLKEQAIAAADTAGSTVANAWKKLTNMVNSEGARSMAQRAEMTGAQSLESLTPAAMSQRAASLRSTQLKMLNQNGVFPVFADDIAAQIDKAIKGTTSDQAKALMKGMKDIILSKADKNGMISSADLYTNVRKVSNQQINKMLGLNEQFASGGIPAEVASGLDNVKKFIDKAINRSSSGLWQKYLDNFGKYSKQLDRVHVGEYLQDALKTSLDKESAGTFANAVRNAAGTLKRSTGIPRADSLGKVLTGQEMAIVSGVEQDLIRATRAKTVSSMTKLPSDTKVPLPEMLNKVVTITRGMLNAIKMGNKSKADALASELFLGSGENFAAFLEAVPKSRLPGFVEMLMPNLSPEVAQAMSSRFGAASAAEFNSQ